MWGGQQEGQSQEAQAGLKVGWLPGTLCGRFETGRPMAQSHPLPPAPSLAAQALQPLRGLSSCYCVTVREARLTTALFLLLLFMTRTVNMRIYNVFYATSLIKKLKKKINQNCVLCDWGHREPHSKASRLTCHERSSDGL